MLPAAVLLGVVLIGFAAATWTGTIAFPALLATWALLGIGYSAAQTPTGRLLRRSAQPEDRPAVFAAQFALSHACWLLAYPLAGWLGAAAGMSVTLGVLGLVTLSGFGLAVRLWPADDPDEIAHAHPDLPPDHPHLREHHGHTHVHAFTIDELHQRWPTRQETGPQASSASGTT
jgi:hypothetical protein